MKLLRASILGCLALLAVGATASVASAATAYVTATVNQRQGPGTNYGILRSIPAGASVAINGCLNGGSWCEVTYAGRKGWVIGTHLEGAYQSRRVAVPSYLPSLGIPTVTFGFGNVPHRYHRNFLRQDNRAPFTHRYGNGRPPRLHGPVPRGVPSGPLPQSKGNCNVTNGVPVCS